MNDILDLEQPEVYIPYTKFAIAQFDSLIKYGKTDVLLAEEKVQRMIASYSALVWTTLFLAKPPISLADQIELEEFEKDCDRPIGKLDANHFVRLYPKIAWKVSDSIFYLVDSCNHAILAIDKDAPKLELDVIEMAMLDKFFLMPWETSSGALKTRFAATQLVLKIQCGYNARYRAALIRLGHSFAIAEELIAEFKDKDLYGYVKGLNH